MNGLLPLRRSRENIRLLSTRGKHVCRIKLKDWGPEGMEIGVVVPFNLGSNGFAVDTDDFIYFLNVGLWKVIGEL
jgi:hypothetical protein